MKLLTDSPILKTKISLPGLKASHSPGSAYSSDDSRSQWTTDCHYCPCRIRQIDALAQWVHGANERCAWVSLDERDNDPVRFGDT